MTDEARYDAIIAYLNDEITEAELLEYYEDCSDKEER